VAKYLSTEWFDLRTKLAADAPERPGVDLRIQNVVTNGPDGDVSYYDVIQNGRLVESAQGEDGQAEITMTTAYADSCALLTGELAATSAFVTGKVKVTGNTMKMMSMMPVANSPEYKEMQDKLAAETEF
jgi:putative sterol carrier protein